MYTMLIKPQHILLTLALSWLILGCSNNQKAEVFFPNPTGTAYEILVIAEEKSWNDTIGKIVRKLLTKEIYGLPQPEPEFDIVQIPHKAFTKIFQTHRNIIDISISAANNTNTIKIKENVWAKPQLQIKIRAKTEQEFITLFEQNKHALLETLQKKERERLVQTYKQYDNPDINKKLVKNFKLRMIIPKHYKLDVLKSDFAWISYETNRLTQSILIYSEAYTDTSQLQADALLEFRNKMLKKHVPGPSKGSYMGTEDFVTPEYTTFALDNNFVARLRGLWTVHGDFMGGPFVSLSMVNPISGQKITAEGFVYAGKQDKRNYMKQLEAILYSIKFVEK